jgi:hypothetical protein
MSVSPRARSRSTFRARKMSASAKPLHSWRAKNFPGDLTFTVLISPSCFTTPRNRGAKVHMQAARYLYKGLEVQPLVFPRQRTKAGFSHSYDEGFDAAVRIQESGPEAEQTRSRVFMLPAERPFQSSGDARRASTAYAEQLIDSCPPGRTIWDSAA